MHGFNIFSFLSSAINEHNIHIVAALFVSLVLVLIALAVRKRLANTEAALVPSGKVSLTNIVEVSLENLLNLMEGVIGPGARKHFPFLATLFLFIFLSNLIGLIPNLYGPTSNINTGIACAICSFLYFNYVGIREHGLLNYLKHFMGPIWWLAPIIFAIELMGAFIRPVTLSLRLFCNINADHMVLGVFSDLVPLFIPIIFLILGIFISFVQAFVFTLLSSIYIALAGAHEEHAHEESHP